MYAYLEQSNRKNFLLHKSWSAKLSIPPPSRRTLKLSSEKMNDYYIRFMGWNKFMDCGLC